LILTIKPLERCSQVAVVDLERLQAAHVRELHVQKAAVESLTQAATLLVCPRERGKTTF
jgi:hypothetical protein